MANETATTKETPKAGKKLLEKLPVGAKALLVEKPWRYDNRDHGEGEVLALAKDGVALWFRTGFDAGQASAAVARRRASWVDAAGLATELAKAAYAEAGYEAK